MAVTLKGNNGTYEGTSEDNKPLDVPVNTEFNELDTGKTYYFDGETWNEEPPCEGSGFTPTTEQLTAMNSGIDSTKVEQIETNKTNILFNQSMGVKNIIKSTATSSGIFTANADGTIKAQGSSGGSTAFVIVSTISASDAYKLNGMILNGCPSGGGSGGYRINLQLDGSPYTNYAIDRGDGAVISGIPQNPSYNLRLITAVEAGKTVDIVFKPMISTIGGEYQPYAMSNVGLTNGILNWSKSENRLLSSQVDVNTMFDVDNSSVYVYTNEILKRVVIATSLKVKTAISSPYSTIALADLPHTHYPIVSINALTSNFRLTKNDANNVIAFTASADVAVGTVLKQQLEYTYY